MESRLVYTDAARKELCAMNRWTDCHDISKQMTIPNEFAVPQRGKAPTTNDEQTVYKNVSQSWTDPILEYLRTFCITTRLPLTVQ